MRKKKGQIGIEAMIVIGVIITIAGIVFFAVNERNIENERVRHILIVRGATDKIAQTINQGVIVGPGYAKNLTVRRRVSGFSITIKVRNRVVGGTWRGIRNETYRVASPLLTSAVEVEGKNNITSNRITIKTLANKTVRIIER